MAGPNSVSTVNTVGVISTADVSIALANMATDATTAPTTLDYTNVGTYNGDRVKLTAGSTLTISASAYAGLTAGLTISVGQSGTATLAFSNNAAKENSAGTSTTSVTLAAAGEYCLQKGDSSPNFRLSGSSAL